MSNEDIHMGAERATAPVGFDFSPYAKDGVEPGA